MLGHHAKEDVCWDNRFVHNFVIGKVLHSTKVVGGKCPFADKLLNFTIETHKARCRSRLYHFFVLVYYLAHLRKVQAITGLLGRATFSLIQVALGDIIFPSVFVPCPPESAPDSIISTLDSFVNRSIASPHDSSRAMRENWWQNAHWNARHCKREEIESCGTRTGGH